MSPHDAPFIPVLRDYHSRRASSFDRTGGNRDWLVVQPGRSTTLADIRGPGCIRHIWMTMGFPHDDYLRRVILRCFWDDCPEPSVECPLGDFFGLGHARRRNFITAMLQMSPEDGRACNAWWPMPFRKSARLEVENQGSAAYNHYFYIDYESYDSPAPLASQAYFHVQWRRENPTQGWGEEYDHLVGDGRQPFEPRPQEWFDKCWFGGDPRSLNTTGRDNYTILEARGDGIYCGAHLDVDIFRRQKNDWFGEGDDMIFIDDEVEALPAGLRPRTWPPALHGTGTEDWYNCAFCPTQEYHAPCHGVLLYSGTPDWRWKGKQSVYRYHILDPIRFRRQILVTIEHGHANKLHNDYSSTAYYYLSTPQRGGPPLPPVEQRLPRPDEPGYPPQP